MMQEEPLIDIPAGHPEGYLEEDIHKTKLTQVVQPIPQGKIEIMYSCISHPVLHILLMPTHVLDIHTLLLVTNQSKSMK